MQSVNTATITYLEADERIWDRVEREWGTKAASHMHLTDGFAIVALENDTLVGLISAGWKKLPPPVPEKVFLNSPQRSQRAQRFVAKRAKFV